MDLLHCKIPNVRHEYRTMDPWNCDHTGLLMFHEAGTVWLHQGNGVPYDPAGPLSALPRVTHHSEPRWSRTEPHTFYFVEENHLMKFDVGKSWEGGAISVVHEFAEYSKINGKGESDISEDGNHFVFCGDDRQIFLYQLSTDNALLIPFADDFESLYVTPDNNVLISGTTGQWLFDVRKNEPRMLTAHNGHKDVCRDTDGKEIMVWTDNRDNGIYKYPLDGSAPTLLLGLPWELAVGISCPDNLGWCGVETYMPKPDPMTEYANKIIRVRLDGSGSEILHDFREMVFPDDQSQPRTVISHDGSRYLYDLNGDSYIGLLA